MHVAHGYNLTCRSAQFTDNGQIIFPPTDSHMPSSPHPPSQGFSSHEALPMVAAFWDDADFSRRVGTTWYQVRVIGDLQAVTLFPPVLTH